MSGIVQGVGYRFWTERTARSLQLSGWARNLYDGRVEIYVEGPADQIEAFAQRCGEGPRSAQVTDVSSASREAGSATTFEIRRDGATPEA